MERTMRFEINNKNEIYDYCKDVCNKAKNMYNVANYYIRNTATALTKEANNISLTSNELEVITTVREMIKENNNKSSKRKDKEKTQLKIPDAKNKYLNYYQLNAIFLCSNNYDYRVLPVHSSQKAIKTCCEMWKSYFKAKKDYIKHPHKYSGEPKIPKYRKNNLATVSFSNQSAIIVNDENNNYLQLPSIKTYDEKGNLVQQDKVKYNLGKLEINNLIKVEIKPFHNIFYLLITIKDNDIKDIYNDENFKTKNIMSIDLGIQNFATITDNVGNNPIIIKGGFLKSRNQYFNKYKAIETSRIKNIYNSSIKLDLLSLKRNRFLRDCFLKIAHKICKTAKERNVNQIVIGHNTKWKESSNIGDKNNQNFVCIPFSQFISTLHTVALKYEIKVIETEESYSSKASFVDRDYIPTYKKGDNTKYKFSGKRTKRGLYISKEGIVLNADVNGSLNILRKYCGDEICKDITDYNKLNHIIVLNYKDFYPQYKSKIKTNI